MAIIDLYADFLGGRSQYDVGNLNDLKQQVAERLNRNDINWAIYSILVNDRESTDEHVFEDGDVVKVISPGIKGGMRDRINFFFWRFRPYIEE